MQNYGSTKIVPGPSSAVRAAAPASSDDDDGAAERKRPKSTKRKSEVLQQELDSGDEATIKERKKKKRRKDADDEGEDGGESAGEGGFIRTRAQRQAQYVDTLCPPTRQVLIQVGSLSRRSGRKRRWDTSLWTWTSSGPT